MARDTSVPPTCPNCGSVFERLGDIVACRNCGTLQQEIVDERKRARVARRLFFSLVLVPQVLLIPFFFDPNNTVAWYFYAEGSEAEQSAGELRALLMYAGIPITLLISIICAGALCMMLKLRSTMALAFTGIGAAMTLFVGHFASAFYIGGIAASLVR